MKTPEEYVAEIDAKLAAMQQEVDALTDEAAELGLPVTQYRWLPLDRRATALRKDIMRAKASAPVDE